MSRGGLFFPLSAVLAFVAIITAFHAIVAPHSVVALVARAADAVAFGASPFSMIGVFALTLALHAGLPARAVEGYVCDGDNVPRTYRLNGVLVLAVCVGLFACMSTDAQTGLYANFYESLFVAFWFGMGVSTFFFTRGGVEKYARCVTKDQLQANGVLRSSGGGTATLATGVRAISCNGHCAELTSMY